MASPRSRLRRTVFAHNFIHRITGKRYITSFVYKSWSSAPWYLWCLLVVVVVAAVGAALGWSFRTKALDSAPPLLFTGRYIGMEMTLHDVDPLTDGGSITVGWNILMDSCVSDPDSDTQDLSNCTLVNIIMDPNLFAGSNDPSMTYTNALPTIPLFQYDPFVDYNSTFRGSPGFQTQLAIWTRYTGLQDSIVNYPFEQYATEIFMRAVANGTNAPVGIDLYLTDGTAFGFDAYILPFNRLGELGIDTAGIVRTTEQYGDLDIFLIIHRGVLVRVYVVVIIAAMWLITLLLLAITVKGVFFRYRIDVAILVIPVATLFAFTSLRASLPGAPAGFGAIIDFVGTLPSLALLVAITVMSMLYVLVQSHDKVLPSSV